MEMEVLKLSTDVQTACVIDQRIASLSSGTNAADSTLTDVTQAHLIRLG